MESVIIDHFNKWKIWAKVALVFEYLPFTSYYIFDHYLNRKIYSIFLFHNNFFHFGGDYKYSNYIIKPFWKYVFNDDYFKIMDLAERKEIIIHIRNNGVPYVKGVSSHVYYVLKDNDFFKYFSFVDNIAVEFYNNRTLKDIIIMMDGGRYNYGSSKSIHYKFDINGNTEEIINIKLIENKERIEKYPNGKIKLHERNILDSETKNVLYRITEHYDHEKNIIKIEGKRFESSLSSYQIIYYRNGKIKQFTSYNNGAFSGVDMVFYPNGKIKEFYTYRDDFFQGPFFEFDSNDRLIYGGSYTKSLLDGFYCEMSQGEVKSQGIYEIIRGESVKRGTWLEEENGVLIEKYYGPTYYLLPTPLIVI